MSIRDRLRRSRYVVLAAAVAVVLVTVANWPVRRLVGVNFVVSEVRLPLWAKAVDFIHRDVNVDAVARATLAGSAGEEATVAAAFTWTRAHIRPQPGSLPVVDDHIWHIIIRGYGEPDQRADVFTTLLAYADVPAYWQLIGEPPEELPLSYVWIRDRWRVYDVDGGVVFRNRRGDQATPEELAADDALIRLAATQHGLDPERYSVYFKGFRPPRSPDVSRADLQMPGRRLWHEMRKLIGVQGREWEMRPQKTGSRLEGQYR